MVLKQVFLESSELTKDFFIRLDVQQKEEEHTKLGMIEKIFKIGISCCWDFQLPLLFIA